MYTNLVTAALTALNNAFQFFLMTIGVKEKRERIKEVDEFKKEQEEIKQEVDQGNVEKINNRLKTLLVLAVLCMAITSCRSAKEMNTPGKLPAMPPEPVWQSFSEDPVKKKLTDNTFEVTDELVEKAIQQTEYINDVRDWKLKNNVP